MKYCISALFASVAILGLVACNGDDVLSNSNSADWSVPLNEVRDGGPGKDGIPALENPEMISADQADYIQQIEDDLRPAVRTGIAMGEIIIADNTVTGAGVVQAQRVEQLAVEGGVCITAAIHQALSSRMPLVLENLGDQMLKGFDHSVGVYRVELKPGQHISPPQQNDAQQIPSGNRKQIIAAAAIVLLIVGGFVYWSSFSGPTDDAVAVVVSTPALPARPSIVVLPFVNQYDDDEQNYFVDGLTNGIITHLSKFPELFVISSTTAFTYEGKKVRVSDIGRELGVK